VRRALMPGAILRVLVAAGGGTVALLPQGAAGLTPPRLW
jgi:hypothetical protein